MFHGCGGAPIESTSDYYDYGAFLDMPTSVDLGIKNDAMYWTSTPRSENPEEYQMIYNFKIKLFAGTGIGSNVTRLRGCLAFNVVNPTVTLSDADDNSAFINANNGKVYDVTLKRTLKANVWNTFSVPFNLTSEQKNTYFGPNAFIVALRTSSLSDGELKLIFAPVGVIVAGGAYLIMPEYTINNPIFQNVTISTNTYNMETTYADFIPVINPLYVTGGDKNKLFIFDGNKVTYSNVDSTIKGFRGYIQLKGSAAAEARSYSLNIDGETTGIGTIDNGELTIGNYYNLKGQRVINPAKGIYVKNGKKVIIK